MTFSNHCKIFSTKAVWLVTSNVSCSVKGYRWRRGTLVEKPWREQKHCCLIFSLLLVCSGKQYMVRLFVKIWFKFLPPFLVFFLAIYVCRGLLVQIRGKNLLIVRRYKTNAQEICDIFAKLCIYIERRYLSTLFIFVIFMTTLFLLHSKKLTHRQFQNICTMNVHVNILLLHYFSSSTRLSRRRGIYVW